MKTIIRGGRIIDPANKIDMIADLMIEDNTIVAVAKDINQDADKVIDATSCYVMPGLIDMHVHLRDPGLTYKEDIESGAKAAAKGGFTTILAMPNTKPIIDDAKGIEYVMNQASKVAPIKVLQVGAITNNQEGKELADIEAMIKAGSPAISEDGKSVMNAKLYREGMKLAAQCDIPVLAHCEDIDMVDGGCVNADETTAKMGLKGITNAVEDVIVARDIILAKETNAHLHLCHCSTKDSVNMVDKAKQDGIKVTAEVCPHHFTLTTQDIIANDTNYKMNPPLRTDEDVKALKCGLQEDIIEVISTDHAPHSNEEKDTTMEEAPFGIVGLETCVALTISELVKPKVITPMQMAEKLSYNPAQILKLDRGTLTVGKVADITVINPDIAYQIDTSDFISKGKNTPFGGREVKGQVVYTICEGEVVYKA
jgi:dihydroorotase, multifunctional complex type